MTTEGALQPEVAQQAVKAMTLAEDLTPLDRAATTEIDAIAVLIRRHLKGVHKNIFEIGSALLRAKEKLSHGRWLPWLDAEFGWTPRTAQNYMNVAARLGDKCEGLSHLGMETLYKLAAPSTPDDVVKAVTSMAQTGKKITRPDVTRMVREVKPKKSSQPRVATLPSPTTSVATETAKGEADPKPQREDETENAFALLKAKLERDRLKRIAYLLERCDVAKLIAMINNHLASNS